MIGARMAEVVLLVATALGVGVVVAGAGGGTVNTVLGGAAMIALAEAWRRTPWGHRLEAHRAAKVEAWARRRMNRPR